MPAHHPNHPLIIIINMAVSEGVGSLRLPSNSTFRPSITHGFSYTGPLSIETAQESSFQEKIIPSNGMTSDPYEFVFEPMGDSYLDMSTIHMYAKLKIVKLDGTEVDNRFDVAPVNNLLNSMWRTIETKVNNVTVNPAASYNIPYKSMMENVIGIENTLNHYLVSSMFVMDTPAKYDTMSEENVGYMRLARLCTQNEQSSYNFDICGPFCNDFIRSDKHLAPGNKLAFRFTRASDEFCLLSKTDEKYKLLITDICLYGTRIRLFPHAQKEIIKEGKPDVYSCMHSEIKEFPLPAGVKQWNLKITNGSTLPKHIIVGFVLTEAHVGSYKKNPFNFQNFKLNRMNLKQDGRRYPQEPLRPDYENGMFAREYNHLFMNTGKYRINSGNCISLEAFKDGMNLYSFDNNPDSCYMVHKHVGKDGSMEVEPGWAAGLEESITAIVYLNYDEVITLEGSAGTPNVEVF